MTSFSAEEVREVAGMALGRISVDLFHEGRARRPASGEPEFDYLRTRSGAFIGYGELARRFGVALDAELEERAAVELLDHPLFSVSAEQFFFSAECWPWSVSRPAPLYVIEARCSGSCIRSAFGPNPVPWAEAVAAWREAARVADGLVTYHVVRVEDARGRVLS